MRILLADDHTLVRDTIASFLESEGGMAVTAAGTLDEALTRLGEMTPFDLVILDYEMPGMVGLDRLPDVIAASSGAAVAIISGAATREVAEAAIDAGAAGFLPKTLTAKSMINAIRFMASGERYAPVEWLASNGPAEAESSTSANPLSPRERQVLSLLCDGKSNKEIARDLDVQEVTVKLHVKTLCRKLDARNRTHAAIIGRDKGLV